MHDALTLLIEDHRRVDALFHRFEQAADPERKQEIVREMTRELSVHAVVEEQYLYPTAARVLPGGDGIAGHSVDEHQEIKDLLAEIDGEDPTKLGYDDAVRGVMAQVHEHVQEEENELFPRLREALSPEQLAALGSAIAMTKLLAPSRPHPGAPNTPPGNVLAGPLAAAVDALRDQLAPGTSADRLLDAVSLGQDTSVRAVQAWIQKAGSLLPGTSSAAQGEGEASPSRLLDDAFDVAQRLLDAQRQFATELLAGGPSRSGS